MTKRKYLFFKAALFYILVVIMNFRAWSQGSINMGTVQVSSIGHVFSPATAAGGPVVMDYFIDQQQTSGGGATVGSVSVNLDVNNQFSITISAPAGEEFFVNVPTSGSVQLSGSLEWSNPDGYYAYNLGAVTAVFGGLQGTAPNFVDGEGAEIAQNHDAFGFDGLDSTYLSSDLAFTSITYTGTAPTPDIGSGTVTYVPSVAEFYAIYYPPIGQTTDPGRFVSIVATPEPNSIGLFFMGILLITAFSSYRVKAIDC